MSPRPHNYRTFERPPGSEFPFNIIRQTTQNCHLLFFFSILYRTLRYQSKYQNWLQSYAVRVGCRALESDTPLAAMDFIFSSSKLLLCTEYLDDSGTNFGPRMGKDALGNIPCTKSIN